jgi:hypothetical protein
MGRTIAAQRTAGGVTTWTVDEDSILVGAVANVAAIVSRDLADISTTSTAIKNSLICLLVANQNVPLPDLPIYKGEQIYLSLGAVGTCILYLTEPNIIS